MRRLNTLPCSVVVADDICRRPVPGECLGNLAGQPLRRRVPSHREPQQLPLSVAKNKKCEELLKGNRRNDEEINRRGEQSGQTRNSLGLTITVARNQSKTISNLSFLANIHTAKEIAKRENISNIFVWK